MVSHRCHLKVSLHSDSCAAFGKKIVELLLPESLERTSLPFSINAFKTIKTSLNSVQFFSQIFSNFYFFKYITSGKLKQEQCRPGQDSVRPCPRIGWVGGAHSVQLCLTGLLSEGFAQFCSVLWTLAQFGFLVSLAISVI